MDWASSLNSSKKATMRRRWTSPRVGLDGPHEGNKIERMVQSE
jgi:hypothetical protein